MSLPVATPPVSRHITVEEGEAVAHHPATVNQASGDGVVYQSVIHHLCW